MMQGKLWGKTMRVYTGANCEVHFLHINKGGYCSEHIHKSKWNRFCLIKGELKITLFRDSGPESIILRPGHISDVPPGVKHKFEGLEECKCLEIYWTDNLDPNDIERFSVGGMKIPEN